MPGNQFPHVTEAAGGLLWRDTPQGRQLAIIHRERYDDWTLPKGKRNKGESWQETALREVKEETGFEAQIDSLAGAVAYTIPTGPKIVLFWNMHILAGDDFVPNDEVDDFIWVTPQEALQKLNYPDEKVIVKKNRSY